VCMCVCVCVCVCVYDGYGCTVYKRKSEMIDMCVVQMHLDTYIWLLLTHSLSLTHTYTRTEHAEESNEPLGRIVIICTDAISAG
jgi:hypothetical protein